MKWELRYSEGARKALRKMDASTRSIILSWLDKNIDGCDDPRAHGKPLVGNLAGAWRYRIGDYRVLCEIRDSDLVILAFEITHRRSVYANRRRKGR